MARRDVTPRSLPAGEWRDLAKQFVASGGRLAGTGSGHIAWYCPQGIVFSAVSPSDHRAIHNIRAELRRKGWTVGDSTGQHRTVANGT